MLQLLNLSQTQLITLLYTNKQTSFSIFQLLNLILFTYTYTVYVLTTFVYTLTMTAVTEVCENCTLNLFETAMTINKHIIHVYKHVKICDLHMYIYIKINTLLRFKISSILSLLVDSQEDFHI